MKNTPILILAIIVLATSCSTLSGSKSKKSKNKTEMTLKTEVDTVSYSIGLNIAENLSNQGLSDLNVDALAQGMMDYLNENDLSISKEQGEQIIQAYTQKKAMEAANKNKKEGEEFLADNAKKEGVVTLPSGMQYEIITEGNGAIPTANDKVKTHYHGTLIDGTVFDSSVERGQPATFGVTQVIKGWQEALQLMPVGSKWRLYIPYDLAYGERGAGGQIGPFATLIFDIELIEIVK
ncbi:Outer membrane protein MIP [Parvicella tangerina]|uniref:Peptidyl-prolyl cis-trans isomerase n=2 Tax=Parvicella tangerina TaxID=2829795 RepID=A0A916JM85_9FLAO|nr:Outer membrane protein MIP [Parvicella tangerina]